MPTDGQARLAYSAPAVKPASCSVTYTTNSNSMSVPVRARPSNVGLIDGVVDRLFDLSTNLCSAHSGPDCAFSSHVNSPLSKLIQQLARIRQDEPSTPPVTYLFSCRGIRLGTKSRELAA